MSNALIKGNPYVTRSFNKYSTNKNIIFNKKVNTVSVNDTTARERAVVSENKEKEVNVVKDSACWGNPQQKEYKEKAVINSGCSRHMTGNKCYLTEYEDYDGGFVSFGDGKGRISRKGKIKTGALDFDDVYICKELKYNLFNVSQICDKKNNIFFTDTECLVLSSDFKLLDESQVLLRVPRKDNIYSVDLKSVVPTRGLTCLFAKATIDESNIWHRRLGHINYKTMNKLVRGNLVRGLPSKIFENDHSCVACQKGKQHKASYKTKLVNSISKPLHMLHMDLFGPTNVKSLMKKSYCLVVTDDFSRFSWVFFLATKDETSGILKTFITGIENQLDYKVKVIRCDNGTEFKNSIMNQFCEMKGIKREFSVAERKNKTLIEAARTMLVDSKLPTTFWAEAVNTACYVLNRVLIIKPHNKTPYELIRRRPPLIDFMKPFGCPVTILNTRDHLGKFDEKADEGFLLGNGPDWLFDVDSLTISMNYVPVVAGNQTNGIAGNKDNIVAGQAEKKIEPEQEYILIPLCITDPLISQDPKDKEVNAKKKAIENEHINSTNSINTVSTVGPSFANAAPSSSINAARTPDSTANAFEKHLFE
ncbi:putative ribonuclease H-like domain-containing protein [Tanacetum coccineum]